MAGSAPVWLEELRSFIVRAKAATYVGDGATGAAHRQGSHDLEFRDGTFTYVDSYFGGADFIGQEVVYRDEEPVWAMNYYGRILEPGMITAAEAGQVIKASLSALYAESRFLGGFEHALGDATYTDTNEGDVASFTGREWISRAGRRIYVLDYHGGLIRD
jgi:hypothetical protein